MKLKKYLKRIGIGMVALCILLFGVFYLYTLDYYKADEIALQIISSNEGEIESKDKMIVFHPNNENNKNIGLIFYPGGKVEASAYAPLLSKLSDQGITCVLVKMPFHLAVFGVNSADKVISQYPEIKNWWIGGHSLGGAMASSYAYKNEESIQGVVLLGAYPTKTMSIPTIVLYGSEDNVLHREKLDIVSNKTQIMGGNHAYFGNYGEQKGDGVATISRETQQEFTVNTIITFIENTSN